MNDARRGWMPMLVALMLAGVATGARGQGEAQARPAPQLWAVVAGIEYRGKGGASLCPGAARDARAFADWLQDTAKWDPDNILRLDEAEGFANHGPADGPARPLIPTRDHLDWAMTQWLGRHVRPGDTVVFWFSGEAAVLTDPKTQQPREVLVPADCPRERIHELGWTPEQAIDQLMSRRWPDADRQGLGSEPALCVVTLLDTSVFGRDRPFVAPPRGDQGGGMRLLNRLARWPGATAWMAADGRPSAATEGRSLFAGAFFSALGSAPNDLATVRDRLRNAAELKGQDFRVAGGIAPRLTLGRTPAVPRPVDPARLLVQQGHSKDVTAMVEAGDGRLFTASKDATVREFAVEAPLDRRGWDLLRVVPVGQPVTAMTASAGGELLVSGDLDGRIRVYDEGRKAPRKFDEQNPHKKPIAALALLPSTTHLASLDRDGKLIFWSLADRGIAPLGASTLPDVTRIASSRREGPAVLAAVTRSAVHLFRADPRLGFARIKAPEGPREPISAVDLSADGRWLAVGYESGDVRVWEANKPAVQVFRQNYRKPVVALKLAADGSRLAVCVDRTLFLADPRAEGRGLELAEIDDAVEEVALSSDGRKMAARTADNTLLLWSLDGKAPPAFWPLVREGRAIDFSTILFGGDGKSLFAGKSDGAVVAWDLDDKPKGPAPPRFRVPPHLGRVGRVVVAPDALHMIAITPDLKPMAMLWDLKPGGVKTLPGYWISGLFLPDGRRFVLGSKDGEPRMFDRPSGEPTAHRFLLPAASQGDMEAQVSFEELAASPDGKYLAGRTGAGARGVDQESFLCVWDMAGGRPKVLGRGTPDRPREEPFVALAFTPDGRSLLSLERDGRLRTWDPASGAERQAAMLRAEAPLRITAAAIWATPPYRVATARLAGVNQSQVELWEGRGDRFVKALEAPIAGSEPAVALLGDGREVAASDDNNTVQVWRAAEARQGAPGRPAKAAIEAGQPEKHHGDRVNCVVAWPSASPDARLFASGSEDGTVRLWRLDGKTLRGELLGMFLAAPEPFDREPEPPARPHPRPADWVAFTPEGVFHSSSIKGESLVRFLRGSRILAMGQFTSAFLDVNLTDTLRRGVRPLAQAPPAIPPDLVIDPPRPDEKPERDIVLTVSWNDPEGRLSELRLYHNDTPIRPTPLAAGMGSSLAIPVRLRDGVNRFYAMGTCAGQVDARSREVPVRYTGPERIAGKVHVLALGVDQYRPGNRLEYAGKDARDLGAFLHKRGLEPGDEPGLNLVLTDRDVTRRKVENAFARIRAEVHNRPEDTVVLFLAGHADVIPPAAGADERFSLLLADFPFPAGGVAVAGRGGARAGAGGVVAAGDVLPYEALYAELLHLDALRRLVIVDACQAGAIEDEPRIEFLRRELDRGSRKSRTSYFLAARRGELANEVSALEHGLLTYSLLRGMGAPGLAPLPDDLRERYAPGADHDGDGTVTTAELRVFVQDLLGDLAHRYPEQIVREGVNPGAPRPARETMKQNLSTQGVDDDFPLVNVSGR